MNINNYIE
uniref:Uncharacterized protein n=1 Tax=Anguilla anguilla TaxID=7936 RepID=A0A0E9TVV5_ANGAN